MKNILTLCDFYGEHFHWYIGYKPRYYSYCGGIFSLLSLFLIIAIFILFGYDDFKRNNPISNTSTVPPKGYKNIKFGQEKLYLPWRIIDYDENPINISGIIYPRIFYFTVQPDNKTGELITKYNLINYKLCNETSMKNLGDEYIIDISIDTLYCIDMEDLNVGGSWNSDFLNFIRFDLYMCEDGIDYNDTNYKCTTYEKLQNVYGGGDSVFFELLYPVVQFQPTNLDIPILIVYKTLYYIFNKFSNKLDRMYLQEHVFEDEQSWIFNAPKNNSYWGVNLINGESYIIGEKDVLRHSSTSKLYTLNIYFELGIVYYTRKYKKLYEILGEIFPIISAVCSFFSFLSRMINELKSAKIVNEYIIGYEYAKHTKSIINKNKKNTKSTKNLYISGDKYFNNFDEKNNQIINKINIFKNKNIQLKENIPNKIIPLSNNMDDSSKIFCNQNNINININSHKIRKSIHKNNTIIIKHKTNYFDNLKYNKKEKYPLYYYFFGYLYNRADLLKHKKKKFLCITEKFYKSFTFYRHIIDITSYLSLYKDFEIFKKVVNEKLNINDINSIQSDIKNNSRNNIFYTEDNTVSKRKFSLKKSIQPLMLKQNII